MSRRLYTYIMLVATIVLSITGCMDRRQGATASRHPKDTLYTEQLAMEAYDYQPERALQMVDSAVAVGDMSHWWGEMLRARIYSSTLGWLQRSRELVEVCHGQGAVTEALRNEAEVGAALCFLGKETEGMARIDSVIALLDVKKFNELDAMLIVQKRKVCVLAEKGHYAERAPHTENEETDKE